MRISCSAVLLISLFFLLCLKNVNPKKRYSSKTRVPYKPSWKNKKNGFSKPKLIKNKKLIVIPVAWILLRKKSYSGRYYPTRVDDFIYFNQWQIPPTFVVNNNKYWTPFLLVERRDKALSCLIVPNYVERYNCPRVFLNNVNRHTKFLLPSDYNSTLNQTRSKDEIALCCNGHGLRASYALAIIISFLTVLHVLFTNESE